jgi:UDP-glucose 4-epimerase
MNYLITGGAGFIGSHLAEALLQRGMDVAVIDDLSTGSILNIEHLKGNPNFHYVLDTMMHRAVLMEMVDRADVIVHLAAAVGVRLIVESPVRTIETNIKGTELVLELAAKKKKKVMIASTSEVYGKALKVPFCEDDDLVMGATGKGRWSYACSKMIDEFLALAYWKEKQVPTVVVRLFNTVGPRQTGQYGMVVPRFISQARRNEPITVYGDGSQRRCFTWVGDVVQALVALSVHPGAVGEIFNLGNTEEVTILELAERAKGLTGSRSSITFVPYEQAYAEGFEDMPRRVPSIDKVHKLIGYKPTLGLDGILKSVNEYFEQRERPTA